MFNYLTFKGIKCPFERQLEVWVDSYKVYFEWIFLNVDLYSEHVTLRGNIIIFSIHMAKSIVSLLENSIIFVFELDDN